MKPTNSVNAVLCRCALQLLLKTVFQNPCSVVEICKAFLMRYVLKSNHIPRILLGSVFQLNCTSMNFHINVDVLWKSSDLATKI